jgi:Flp pilus assembly protein TadD
MALFSKPPPATPPPIATLLSAARAAPVRTDIAAQLGVLAPAERREEDALPLLLATARRSPEDPRLLHVIGLLHRALGDLAAAIEALDRALAFAPPTATLLNARAVAAFDAGLPSLGWYERAQALAPNDGQLVLGRAAALLCEHSAEAADALLRCCASIPAGCPVIRP